MEAGVGVPSPELGRNRFLSLQDPLWADPACTGIPAAGDRTLHQSGSVESDDSSRHARQLSHRCITWIRQGTRLLPSIFVQQRRVDLETCVEKYHDAGTNDFLTGMM